MDLLNYRQYVKQRIDFSRWTEDKHIIVIQGAMGAGKTNLLNAITWCLFGSEKHLTSKSKGLEICSASTMGKMKTGDCCEVVVELALLGNDGKHIYINRRKRYEKDYQGNVNPAPYDIQGQRLETLLRVDRETEDQVVHESPASQFIQRLIPEELSMYCLFDGDKLNQYFEENSSDIPQAVQRISQLDLLEQSITHLESAETEMVREHKDPSEEVKEYQKEHDRLSKRIEECESKVGELRTEQKGYEDRITEIDSWMLESTAGAIKQKATERGKVEAKIPELKEELRARKNDKLTSNLELSSTALFYPAFKTAIDLVKQAKMTGKLPPAYKKDFLERILAESVCICGSSLEPGTKPRAQIKRLLDECDDVSNLTDDLSDLSGRLRSEMDRFPSGFDSLVRVRKSLSKLEHDLQEASERQAQLERELRDFNIEEIDAREGERKNLRAKSSSIENTIGRYDGEKQTCERQLSDVKNKITRAMQRDARYKKDLEKRQLCESAIDSAIRIRDEVISEIRKEVQELTSSGFKNMHWKKGAFSEVTIDEDYSVSVKDSGGREALGTLSRGETQILAYAFMNALNVVSAFDFPLVIDTPLGRISSEPRIALGNSLKESLKGRQMIFLMTDVEYTPDFKKAIEESVAEEYEIQHQTLPGGEGSEAKVVRMR